MQVLALTLMEPPTSIDADRIRDEKVKLLQAIDIPDPDEAVDKSVRGQYTAGHHRRRAGRRLPRRRRTSPPTARPRPIVALRLRVDNWRWAGVPIYVRTGKRLPATGHRGGPALPAGPLPRSSTSQLSRDLRPNTLILRIQPDEGISLEFGAKVPGEKFHVRSVAMDFSYAEAFAGAEAADGYERLLHDAMVGDATLFIRTDEVEQAWRIVDPYLAGLVGAGRRPCTSTRPGPGDRTWPTCWSSGRATSGAIRCIDLELSGGRSTELPQ